MSSRLLFLSFLLLAPAALPAQERSIVVGDRVRVAQPNRPPLVGTITMISSDAILIEPTERAGTTVSVPRGAAGVEASRGRGNHAAIGALIGAGLGTGVTLAFLEAFCGGDTVCDGDEQVRAFAIFALPPALVGGIIGAVLPRERWGPVDWSRVGLAVGRSAGRLSVGLTIGI